MPPQLSEAWATAYIQILTMLCIFALGIPALMFQLVVQDDIRHVFHRHMRVTGWVTSVAIILLTFIMFVWFLHPPFRRIQSQSLAAAKNDTGNTIGSAQVTPSPVQMPSPGSNQATRQKRSSPQMKPGDSAPGAVPGFVAAATPVATVSPSPITTPAGSGSALDADEFYVGAIVASMAMTLIPMLVIALGFMQVSYLRRPHLIKYLERELIDEFPRRDAGAKRFRAGLLGLRHYFFRKYRAKNKAIKQGSRSGNDGNLAISRRLDEETLNDLLYLGQHGKPGKEKSLALEALARIADVVQNGEGYQGDELEDLIRGLKDVVLNDERSGDDENFNEVNEILKQIRDRLSNNKSTSRYIDAGLTVKVLEELGVAAVRSKSEQTAERFMEKAAFSSSIVFNMGLTALANKQFHVASFALNKLESLAEEKGLVAGPETYDLLGLIAHFLGSGVAARMRAETFLLRNASLFSPNITDCLQGAYEHHYFGSNYGTADLIFELQQEIVMRNWAGSLSFIT